MAVQTTGGYGTYGTSAGAIGPQYTYVLKKALEIAKYEMPLHTFAQKKLIPLNSGKIAQFTRLMHLLPVTSAATEGAAVTTINPYAQDFSVTVKEWENAIAVSTLLDDTFITPALEAYIEILGINMGESMNLELQKTLWGEDNDEATLTYESEVGCMGLAGSATAATLGYLNRYAAATTSGSTTTFLDNTLNDTTNLPGYYNDTYIGGSIVFTNPASQNYGRGRLISDYASATGTITWIKAVPQVTQASAAASTPLSADYQDTAHVCALSRDGDLSLNLTQGTDIMTASLIRRSVAMLRKNGARPISGADYVAILGPESFHSIGSGTSTGDFIDISKYDRSQMLTEKEVGRIAGCRIIFESKPYRLGITSEFDYSATGGLHVSFVLGRDCLGACGLQGQNALGESDTQVIIKRPGPQTTSDPSNKFCTAAWKTNFARLSLNACWGVGIVTYPLAL